MIIFTPIRNIPVEMLEYKGIRQVVTYNLSSYYGDIPTLNLLVPSSEYISEDVLSGDCATPEFDVSYINSILSNDESFIQFMSIIIPSYLNPDVMVQILINSSPYRDAITESLIKFIQQRYGYNSYLINELEDFYYTSESDFSIPGLFALDQDIKRWHTLVPPNEEEYV